MREGGNSGAEPGRGENLCRKGSIQQLRKHKVQITEAGVANPFTERAAHGRIWNLVPN